MSLQEAKQFVANFVTGDYTPEEKAAFMRWLSGATVAELNIIADEHEALHESWPLTIDGPSSEWVVKMERKLDVAVEKTEDEEEAVVVPMGRIRHMRARIWIAAASVGVVLSAGAYVYLSQKGDERASMMRERELSLTMSFTVPRGEQQRELILSDGSKVWLNAASVLKYPVAFTGSERTGSERVVELSGEAYFEVTPNPANPFRVLIKDAEVEVLGTDFNVMAYEDEPISRTTLVDGSVKIESGTQSVKLEPGQQAQVPYPSPGVEAPIKVLSGIDPQTVLAWKEGELKFDHVDLQTVMRSLARTYNVEVQVDPAVASSLVTALVFDRNVGLANILEQLVSLNIAHFKFDGKRVTVTPV